METEKDELARLRAELHSHPDREKLITTLREVLKGQERDLHEFSHLLSRAHDELEGCQRDLAEYEVAMKQILEFRTTEPEGAAVAERILREKGKL